MIKGEINECSDFIYIVPKETPMPKNFDLLD